MISDLDGELGSRCFLNVANERTCLASRLDAAESVVFDREKLVRSTEV